MPSEPARSPSVGRTAIDLFAGAGGATQGLRDAGFVILAAAENDRNAAASFAINHPDVVMAGDVRDIVPDRLRGFLGLRRGELDISKHVRHAKDLAASRAGMSIRSATTWCWTSSASCRASARRLSSLKTSLASRATNGFTDSSLPWRSSATCIQGTT